MKTRKLTQEQLEKMSYSDVAELVLTENKKPMKVQDLFTNVIKLMELPDSFFEKKIGDFFALLSTDKRFIMIEKGLWDLRINHSNKITISVDEEEDEEEVSEEEETYDDITDEEDVDNNINYDDDDTVDDDDDDDYKDLVIINEGEDSDGMM